MWHVISTIKTSPLIKWLKRIVLLILILVIIFSIYLLILYRPTKEVPAWQLNLKSPKPRAERRYFDPNHYDRLIADLREKSVPRWNIFHQEIIRMQNEEGKSLTDSGAYLEGAEHIGPYLNMAKLKDLDFRFAHLEGAQLSFAHLEGADMSLAHLDGASLYRANLKGANLTQADLQGADLFEANLEGVDLRLANLEGARVWMAVVDGSTSFWHCKINNDTDFRGVGLDNARINPGLKDQLKYNIRRIRWEEWYKDHFVQEWPVRVFWWVSDYGRSTFRIFLAFIVIACFFAMLYWIYACISPPGMVRYLLVDCEQGQIGKTLAFVRAFYFSVVTMTTLGFGDMYAESRSYVAYICVTLQVVSGYFLLGALITRLAILFTSSGPSG